MRAIFWPLVLPKVGESLELLVPVLGDGKLLIPSLLFPCWLEMIWRQKDITWLTLVALVLLPFLPPMPVEFLMSLEKKVYLVLRNSIHSLLLPSHMIFAFCLLVSTTDNKQLCERMVHFCTTTTGGCVLKWFVGKDLLQMFLIVSKLCPLTSW